MDDVRIHRNSAEPAKLGALAFTRGSEIHLGPGQDQHLPHEAWHVVQQKQGRVQATMQMKGAAINDDAGLEHEADRMGDRASIPTSPKPLQNVQFRPSATSRVIQRQPDKQAETASIEAAPKSAIAKNLDRLNALSDAAKALAGIRVPVPARVIGDTAVSFGPGPSFSVEWEPGPILNFALDQFVVKKRYLEGTPVGGPVASTNRANVAVKPDVLSVDAQKGLINSSGKIDVPSTSAPQQFIAPTTLDYNIVSDEPTRFHGQIGVGPIHADFRVKVRHDKARVESALAPVFQPKGGLDAASLQLRMIIAQVAPGAKVDNLGAAISSLAAEAVAGRVDGDALASKVITLIGTSLPKGASASKLRTALVEFVQEIRHPGFVLTGGLSLGPIPSRFRLEAPTSRPLKTPLVGALRSYPYKLDASGVILAPAGVVTSIPVPAFGKMKDEFGETKGSGYRVAALPTVSIAGLQSGSALRAFPTYLYAEYKQVRRVSDGFDISVSLIFSLSTVDVANLLGKSPSEPADNAERIKKWIQYRKEASDLTSAAPPFFAGVSVSGHFPYGGSK